MKATIENGPLPIDIDASLWRYVSLPGLLLYLDRRVRLPSIMSLRRIDKLEGLPSWDHVTQADAFSNEEHEKLFEYVRSRLSANERELFEVNAAYPGANQRVVYDHWSRLITWTRYGLCFFLAGHESIAMWRLYAPQGFAIRTSLRSLNKALENTRRKWRISQMKYWDKSKEINPDETHGSAELMAMLRRPFLLKSREYEYEKEVRLFTVESRARPHLLVDGVLPEDWIEQIRISPEVWAEDAELLRGFIKMRAPALENKIVSSPLVGEPNTAESIWSELEAQVSQEDAEKNWPEFLWEP